MAEFQLGSHQFPGERQNQTPVTDAVGLVIIVNLLPGQRTARFRVSCARIVVRYLGGDETLVNEIRDNRRAQEALPEEHPARIFGQAVESEADTREREADEAIARQLKRERLKNELQAVRLQSCQNLAESSRRVLDTLGAGDPPPATLQMLKAAQHNFSSKTLAVMGSLMGNDPAPVEGKDAGGRLWSARDGPGGGPRRPRPQGHGHEHEQAQPGGAHRRRELDRAPRQRIAGVVRR